MTKAKGRLISFSQPTTISEILIQNTPNLDFSGVEGGPRYVMWKNAFTDVCASTDSGPNYAPAFIIFILRMMMYIVISKVDV